jgi:hypothetical protein
MNNKILGIDASTNGSGGVQRHLIEILRNFNPAKHNFSKIVVWGSDAFLDKIPNNNFVTKITHRLLNKSIFCYAENIIPEVFIILTNYIFFIIIQQMISTQTVPMVINFLVLL